MSANKEALQRRKLHPTEVVAQINIMYRAAVAESKRREELYGYPLAPTRAHYENVRAYLVQLVEESSE